MTRNNHLTVVPAIAVEPRLTPVSLLSEAPWNPRLIRDPRFENLCESLQIDSDFLWLRPILATMNGDVFAGNMRLRAARHLGWDEVPAILVDIPEQLAKERALRDNGSWGENDDGGLAELLVELERMGSNVHVLGPDDAELQRLFDTFSASSLAPAEEDIPPLPAEPLSRRGDLWLLGDPPHQHRVLCGDTTDAADVGRAVGDDAVNCVWTDFPYGVSYVGGTKDHLTIKNDNADGLRSLLTESLANIDAVLSPGAAIYLAHPAGALSVTFGECFLERGWRLHQTLVWVKDSLVLGRSDYHYRHEPILYGYKPSGHGRRGRGGSGWYGGNAESSVFEVPRPRVSADHPTSKPVELVRRMIRNSSRPGDVVADFFLGSGPTLLATEALGHRRFVGIDLDPRYVDVAIRRWERLTGKTAMRE